VAEETEDPTRRLHLESQGDAQNEAERILNIQILGLKCTFKKFPRAK